MRSYFDLDPAPDLAAWPTLADLTDDPRLLATKVAATHAALGPVPVRVAASVDFGGVAARVVSPLLRAGLTGGGVPRLTPGQVRWRPAQPGPILLAWDAAGAGGGADVTAVVDALLAPLAAAYAGAFRLSPQVLRAAVASSVATAAELLGEPALGRTTLTGSVFAPGVRQWSPHFVRNGCCLLHRVPGAGVCGDCILRLRRG